MSSAWIFSHDNAYLRPYAFLDAGILACHGGDPSRGCRLVACANRIFRESDSTPDPDDQVELDDITARLRGELGDRFDSTWAEGEGLAISGAQRLARL